MALGIWEWGLLSLMLAVVLRACSRWEITVIPKGGMCKIGM